MQHNDTKLITSHEHNANIFVHHQVSSGTLLVTYFLLFAIPMYRLPGTFLFLHLDTKYSLHNLGSSLVCGSL
jgi:hypothetical protein